MASVSPDGRGRAYPRAHLVPIGARFGRVVVTSLPFKVLYCHPPKRYTVVAYRCDCGNEGTARPVALLTGECLSCGCGNRDAIRQSATRHGENRDGQRTRLYGVWAGMVRRCHTPGDPRYPNYGARGIFVCAEWRQFPGFRDWARANGYADHLVIDRIDNARGYSPDNCRFVTYTQSNRNTSHNRWITAFGETQCLKDWLADPRCVVTAQTLLRRLLELGWLPEEALTKPGRSGRQKKR